MKSCLGLLIVFATLTAVVGGGALLWYLSINSEFKRTSPATASAAPAAPAPAPRNVPPARRAPVAPAAAPRTPAPAPAPGQSTPFGEKR